MLEEEGVTILACSSIHRTAPVPVSDQPWFANAVIRTETALSAAGLLELLHDIEARFDRVRTVRNAARTLDLDLVDHAGMVSGEGDWPELPHPRMHERGFVLLPLAEIAPDWRHPVNGAAITDLIDCLPQDQRS
jgi:2-amino-4-hydroxy-6-hydroxymethyldihydropteridine diphosphokinase